MKAKSDLVRERILKSAAERIFFVGVRGWNMDQLAAQSGITKRTLYKIIPSKEQLIEDVVMDFIQGVQTNISKLIEEGVNYLSVLEKIVENFPLFLDRMNSATMQDIFMEYPAIEERVYARRAELTERLVSYFKTGIDNRYLKKELDPNFVLELFQAIVLYFVRFVPKEKDYSDKIRAAFGCVLHGIVRGQAE